MVVFDNRPQRDRDRDAVAAAERAADTEVTIARIREGIHRERLEANRKKQAEIDEAEAFRARLQAIRAERERQQAGERDAVAADLVSAIMDLKARVANLEARLQLRG